MNIRFRFSAQLVIAFAFVNLSFLSPFVSASGVVEATKARGSITDYEPVPSLDMLRAQNTRLNRLAAEGGLNQATITGMNVHGAIVSEISSGVGRTEPAAAIRATNKSARHTAGDATGALPFTDPQNIINFIQNQRQMVSFPDGSRGLGLPATYSVPPGTRVPSEQVINQGAGLYDTSLAILSLLQNGNIDIAKQLLSIYVGGFQGNMDMRAFPNQDNQYAAFQPFTADAYYFFDQTRANGTWSPDWQQYSVHTGPNAWLVIALAKYIEITRQNHGSESQLAPYVQLAQRLADAMIALQIQTGPEAGAILYGPKQSNNSNNEINMENDLSAYAALNAISRVTNISRYQKAASKILDWIQNSSVYNPVSGQTQQGMLDPKTGLFFNGLSYKYDRWEVQTGYDYQGNSEALVAADSGGTWAISALGVDQIDARWGSGAALNIWTQVRRTMGRTVSRDGDGNVTMNYAGDADPLDGLDFGNQFSDGLISTEWTGGGVNAVKQLMSYYQSGKGTGTLSDDPIAAMQNDVTSMQVYIAQHSTSYATGPGLAGSRLGQTGFLWQVPTDSVTSMAALYAQLNEDPLAWARGN